MRNEANAFRSRRAFLTNAFAGIVGAGMMRIAPYPADCAQQWPSAVSPGQFEIEKVMADVYFARALPWAIANSNAAVFVNASDVLIIDAHSHPAAATALIAQIKREVTPKPVRWLANTHFHWDHTQGNRAYLGTANHVDIIASNTTKQLMTQLLLPRLRAALDPLSPGPRGSQQVARQLEQLRQSVRKPVSQTEKVSLREGIAELESFAAEMKAFEPALPTITFDKSYVIREKDYDLHLEFHGYGHTAGDIVVFCPQKRIVVTGDAHHPGFPGFIDSYPQLWPKQVDSILNLQFDHILPGHGRVEHDRRGMIGRRNYIEELTERVIAGKKAGQSVHDLQRSITAASLNSLRGQAFLPDATPDTVESGIKNCIDNMYDRVEKVLFSGTEPIRLRQAD